MTEAVNISEKIYDSNSTQTAWLLYKLAHVSTVNNKPTEAKQHFNKAITIFEGKNSVMSATCLNLLAWTHIRQHEYTEAKRYYERATEKISKMDILNFELPESEVMRESQELVKRQLQIHGKKKEVERIEQLQETLSNKHKVKEIDLIFKMTEEMDEMFKGK